MQMDRSVIKRVHISEDKDVGYLNASKADLLSMMWEITQDAWAFVRGADVKQRLQRDVGILIRRRS
ncbi:MAG: hypothetical protein GY870_19240 [archaeon]|nr:hypothetical protein [archaeon]